MEEIRKECIPTLRQQSTGMKKEYKQVYLTDTRNKNQNKGHAVKCVMSSKPTNETYTL